jgi:hypothetical protein
MLFFSLRDDVTRKEALWSINFVHGLEDLNVLNVQQMLNDNDLILLDVT